MIFVEGSRRRKAAVSLMSTVTGEVIPEWSAVMLLILKSQRKKLLANGVSRARDPDRFDPLPVVKLFMIPACTWLLASLDPGDEDLAFGLAELGAGHPEMGLFRLSDLEGLGVSGTRPFKVERDKFFVPRQTIMGYAQKAIQAGRIEP